MKQKLDKEELNPKVIDKQFSSVISKLNEQSVKIVGTNFHSTDWIEDKKSELEAQRMNEEFEREKKMRQKAEEAKNQCSICHKQIENLGKTFISECCGNLFHPECSREYFSNKVPSYSVTECRC